MANPLRNIQYQHILDEDVIAATTNRRPTLARDQRQAQLVLQEHMGDSGLSVYEHMSAMLKRILDDRPPNVMDYFEDFSRQVRSEKVQLNENRLRPTYVESLRLAVAHQLMPILKLPPPELFPGANSGEAVAEPEAKGEDGEEPPRDGPITDVMHLQFYWQLAGLGFPASQVYILSCCMRQLEVDNPSVISSRFWGQIYGLDRSYFIVETELSAEVLDAAATEDLQAIEDVRQQHDQAIAERAEEFAKVNEKTELLPKRPKTPVYASPNEYPPPVRHIPDTPPVPPPTYKKKREFPPEVAGTGLNRKTYFICHKLGEKWIQLPNVTQQQIQVSRQIKKFLTGNLEAELWSYPIFPGVEKNLLRAIIARITSSTYVAPTGYYRVGNPTDGEEEEEEVDEEDHNNDKPTSLDPGYEPIAPKELLLPQSWVHYRPNVLKQGRINWMNPKDLEPKDEEEAEEEEEEEETAIGEEEEIGPTLLTPCSEDTWKWQPWTIRQSQIYNPSQSMVVIRSNIWPGAFSFAQLRNHDSLYAGWGYKCVERNYSPIGIPGIESEYPVGPEVMEIMDPTLEEEEAWRLAHEIKQLQLDGEGEGEGEEMGEDEEPEEDY